MRTQQKYLIAFALAASVFANAHHASAQTADISIGIRSILALYCYDKVNVKLTSEAIAGALQRSTPGSFPDLNGDAALTGNEFTLGAGDDFWNRGFFRPRTRINLDMESICSYRIFGGATGARVRIDGLQRILEGPDGSSLRIIQFRVRDNETGGAWRRSFDLSGPVASAPGSRGIDVRLRFDVTNIAGAGSYSSTTDGTFRITVIGNP